MHCRIINSKRLSNFEHISNLHSFNSCEIANRDTDPIIHNSHKVFIYAFVSHEYTWLNAILSIVIYHELYARTMSLYPFKSSVYLLIACIFENGTLNSFKMAEKVVIF